MVDVKSVECGEIIAVSDMVQHSTQGSEPRHISYWQRRKVFPFVLSIQITEAKNCTESYEPISVSFMKLNIIHHASWTRNTIVSRILKPQNLC